MAWSKIKQTRLKAEAHCWDTWESSISDVFNWSTVKAVNVDQWFSCGLWGFHPCEDLLLRKRMKIRVRSANNAKHVVHTQINAVSSSHKPPLRKRNNRERSQLGVTHPVLKFTGAEIIGWYAYQWELSYHDDSQWYEYFSQHVCLFTDLVFTLCWWGVHQDFTHALELYIAAGNGNIFTVLLWVKHPFNSLCVSQSGVIAGSSRGAEHGLIN